MSTNESPGVAVIFNFMDFDDPTKHPKRIGSEVDVKDLINVYSLMNLKVAVLNNLNLNEFNAIIKNLSSKSEYDFNNVASIHIVFMSHGDEGNIIYCKGGKFNFLAKSNEVFQNPTLTSKPKFIIVEACKGRINTDNSFDNGSTSSSNIQYSRCTILTSSCEGYVSFLNREKGSPFINKYCEVLKEQWYKGEFWKVLENVSTAIEFIPQAPTLYLIRLNDDFSFDKFV